MVGNLYSERETDFFFFQIEFEQEHVKDRYCHPKKHKLWVFFYLHTRCILKTKQVNGYPCLQN